MVKYFSYKIKWVSDKEGTHPFEYLATVGAHAKNAFAIGEQPNETHYAYLLSGNLDEYSVSEWNIVEISDQDILEASHNIDSAAILDNGRVYFQTPGPGIFVTA